uniref:Immunoglobulin V-set domain-containing protein n=1 Tax=Gadus morhua TaxID=8049 RepID=A0A8C5AGY7_GADMO
AVLLLLRWKPGCGLLWLHFYLDVISTEGLTVSLDCTFVTMINDFPRLMLRRFTIGEGDNAEEFHKERFDAKIQNTSVPLSIQNLQLSDSALYYCALKPRVTGNTDSLYKNLYLNICLHFFYLQYLV